jgi:hypothetical protein
VVKVRYAPFVTITHGTPLPAGEQWPPGAPPHAEPLPLGDPPARGEAVAEQPPGEVTAEQWAAAVEQAAGTALAKFAPGRPVRLLGVRAEFADNPD